MNKKTPTYTWPLLAIVLLLAALLRLLPLGTIPFFNDELSALSRLGFPSFGEMVEYGIKPDGHPAGVQAFLYAWEGLIGFDEFMLRLPFALFSIASVFLLFLITKNFFHPTAGLIAAAFYAVLQYTLFYGIQIRPYAPGQFFVLLMLWGLQQVWIRKEEKLSVYWWTFMLAGIACGYLHYFAGLQAIVVGMMALFAFPRKQKKLVLFAGIGAVLLYLPHVSIFLAQIEKGGIGGWLPPPGPDFFRSYLSYILHHSWKFGLFVLFTWIMAATQKVPLTKEERSYRRFLVFGFLIPIGIGLAYSLMVNPVLHEGSAYFAFPFLVMFLLSFVPDASAPWQRGMTAGILILGVGSLFLERNHVELSTDRGMEEVMEDHLSWMQEANLTEPELPVLFLSSNNPEYPYFYEASDKIDFVESPDSYADFRQTLTELNVSRVGLGWVSKPLDLEYIAIAREFFPYIKLKREYFVSEYYGLETEAGGLPGINAWKAYAVEKERGTNPPIPQFKGRDRVLDLGTFSPAISLELDSLEGVWNQWQLWASTETIIEEASEAKLVLSFQIEDSVLHQETMPLHNFVSDSGEWNWCHKVVRLKHSPFKTNAPEGVQLKVYVWNPGEEKLMMSELRLEIWQGNSRLYGLFEPMIQP